MFSRCLNVFGVEKKLSILALLWTMVLLDGHVIHLRLFAIDLYQSKTQKHIKSFVQFVLMVIIFTITLIVQRH